MYFPLQYASVLYHLCPNFVPCSIGSPLFLNFRRFETSPSTTPRLIAIWTGFSVPQMIGRSSAEMAPTPRPMPSENPPRRPEYSALKRSPACAGDARARADAAESAARLTARDSDATATEEDSWRMERRV